MELKDIVSFGSREISKVKKTKAAKWKWSNIPIDFFIGFLKVSDQSLSAISSIIGNQTLIRKD